MMLFFDSLAVYLSAWAGALAPRGRRLAPLGPRRLLVLLAFPLFLLLQAFHAICLLLDHLLFPRFRHVRLRRPVFVLGVPRSGTTFLHRELARDLAFTAPRSWEVVLAPSLCQRHALAYLARVDRALGKPVGRWFDRALGKTAGDLQSIHPVGLHAAEEDYLALLPTAGCFFVHLMFPQAAAFLDLARPEAMPARRRERLLAHYHRLLQRQVCFHGGAQLLSKNAAFAGWAPYLAARYPDALFVYCIRAPGPALASQLTSLAAARRLFASYPCDSDLEATFAGCYANWWETLASTATALAGSPLIVEQEWLRGHTEAVIALVYRQLDRAPPVYGAAGDCLPSPGPRAGSWPLSADTIACMQLPYQCLRSLAQQQRGASA